MKKSMWLLAALSLCLISPGASAQGLDPALLTKPATDSWPTYAGDYSQRRYSTLKQIDQSNVKNLTLAWIGNLPIGASSGFSFFSSTVPTIVGGEATTPVTGGIFPTRVGGGILQVNGILYASAPDNAWAVDARTGTVDRKSVV